MVDQSTEAREGGKRATPAPKDRLEWLTESLRFSAFSTKADDPRMVSFEELVGRKPDQINERPAQNIRQETGAIGNFRLLVSCQLGRSDVVLSKPPSQTPDLFAQIGPYQDVCSTLTELLKPWLTKVDVVKRLAVAPTMVRGCGDRSEAHKFLKRLLPRLDFDPTMDLDLIWQINRPRSSSSIPNLTINRLSRWQVFDVQLLAVGPAGPQVSQSSTALAQVDLDINTAAERRDAFKSRDAMALLAEVVAMADEIMTKGDVR